MQINIFEILPFISASPLPWLKPPLLLIAMTFRLDSLIIFFYPAVSNNSNRVIVKHTEHF
jgi:hypothetical protein